MVRRFIGYKIYYDYDKKVDMAQEEQGSDELLGAEAIDQEKERVAKEELRLAAEEEVTENTEPDEDEDGEDYDEDEDPPEDQEKPDYDTSPPAEEEI